MLNRDIIATRTLQCETPAKQKAEVVIALTKPEKAPDSEDWSCCCVIEGADLKDSMPVFGADSMQSLLLAEKALRVKLEYFAKRGYQFKLHTNLGDGLS
jgi:hypothetical protein